VRRAPPPLPLPQSLARVVAWATGQQPDRRLAGRLLRLCDLNGLGGQLDQWALEALCRDAQTMAGPVAAVVVEQMHVRRARRLLEGTGIRTATVVNHPQAAANPMAVREQARRAVGDGAEEIGLLLPYRAVLAGDRAAAPAAITACKAECGPDRPLTAILETGAFKEPEPLTEACRNALAEGADFLQTSSGLPDLPGATPEAAALMLEAIRARRLYGDRLAGLKTAGGISSIQAAIPYIAMAEAGFGRDTVSFGTFRLGAGPALLEALVRYLEAGRDAPGR
jgi:deoxyribose-phosphate aldolase